MSKHTMMMTRRQLEQLEKGDNLGNEHKDRCAQYGVKRPNAMGEWWMSRCLARVCEECAPNATPIELTDIELSHFLHIYVRFGGEEAR